MIHLTYCSLTQPALIALFGFLVLHIPSDVTAGPPLLCHPIEIGTTKSLPGGTFRFGTSADYHRRNLIGETLSLLKADMPVLVRMETLRRAAIYATNFNHRAGRDAYTAEDRELAYTLLARLKERSKSAPKDALILFDLGYYTECLRQSRIGEGLSGFDLMTKALELRRNDPEMEFACALASVWPKRPEFKSHLERARAGASDGSLLQQNLKLHFQSS